MNASISRRWLAAALGAALAAVAVRVAYARKKLGGGSEVKGESE